MISVDHGKPASENYVHAGVILQVRNQVRNSVEANAPRATRPVFEAIETNTDGCGEAGRGAGRGPGGPPYDNGNCTGVGRTANDPVPPAIEHPGIARRTLNTRN